MLSITASGHSAYHGTFGDTPGIRTFYDSFSRLWQSDSDNLSKHERYKSSKVKKEKKKGDKTPIQPQSISSRMIPFFRVPSHKAKPSLFTYLSSF